MFNVRSTLISRFRLKSYTFRMLRASLWVTPLVDLPLMDRTLSPFWIRPSRSAKVPGMTLCTCYCNIKV